MRSRSDGSIRVKGGNGDEPREAGLTVLVLVRCRLDELEEGLDLGCRRVTSGNWVAI